MNWLDLLNERTKEAETPRSFIYWAGISAISAVASPNVWLNRGGVYNLCPNTYIILYGDSGLGKGLPLNLAKKTVSMVKNHTRVISGRNTIQSIIVSLSQIKSAPDGSMPTYKDARGYIISGEFASLLQEDKQALTILTDLYDTHYQSDDPWVNTTKSSGIEALHNPILTLFSGASPSHFFEAIPKVNIYGGFVGRTLIVHESKRWKSNPLDDTAVETAIDYKELSQHLIDISKVKGPFTYSPHARKAWKEWYMSFRPKEIEDKTGQVNRIPDHILKVAMCISLSKKLDRVIEIEDLSEAIDNVLEIAGNTKQLVKGHAGDSSIAKHLKKVMEILLEAPNASLTKKALLAKGFGEFDAFELDKVAHTLEVTGLINYYIDGPNTTYQVTPDTIEKWKSIVEEEKQVH